MVHVGYVQATSNLCITDRDYVPEKTNFKYYFTYIAMTSLYESFIGRLFLGVDYGEHHQ